MAEQPLYGLELQEKIRKADYKKPTDNKCLLSLGLKTFRLCVKRKKYPPAVQRKKLLT